MISYLTEALLMYYEDKLVISVYVRLVAVYCARSTDPVRALWQTGSLLFYAPGTLLITLLYKVELLLLYLVLVNTSRIFVMRSSYRESN